MKKAIVYIATALFLSVAPLALAGGPELSDKEIDERSDRLDVINNELQQSLPDQEKANLLFEKAQLMFSTFGPLYLRTATESLLKAIEIVPNKKEYNEFLAEAYNAYWRDRDFSGDDQVSKDLFALKERCRKILYKTP